VVRELREEEIQRLRRDAIHYVEKARAYRHM